MAEATEHICRFCKIVYKQAPTLSAHYVKNHYDKLAHCTESGCRAHFLEQKSLLTHVIRAHLEFVCPIPSCNGKVIGNVEQKEKNRAASVSTHVSRYHERVAETNRNPIGVYFGTASSEEIEEERKALQLSKKKAVTPTEAPAAKKTTKRKSGSKEGTRKRVAQRQTSTSVPVCGGGKLDF